MLPLNLNFTRRVAVCSYFDAIIMLVDRTESIYIAVSLYLVFVTS